MHKTFLPATLAATLMLGGCAGIGGILDPILGNDDRYDDRNLSQFERAAVEACGRDASRYGRAQVTDVRQSDREYVQVRGRIDTRDRRDDEFYCVFRNDGRIVEFRVS